ncbi:MAG: hypothetical protein FWG19_02880, partial [Methanomassiliicoccaceae archaeon]|nr:hypothetical protein [Methanomassiliicoccaceae archaeon]
MNKIAAIVCVIALTATLPCLSYDAAASNYESLWLYEIIPAGSFEAVTIYNAGSSALNMKDYYLDDGEGTLRFTEDIHIGSKEKITFVSAAPNEWFTGRVIYRYGTHGLVAKSFILADNGDEVSLKRISDDKV